MGNLYIADVYNNRIRKINNTGVIGTIAGGGSSGLGDGGQATIAVLNRPTKLFIDVSSNLYIDDFLDCMIRKVNTLGVINDVAGVYNICNYSGDSGQATSAELNHGTNGVAVDVSGNLYISDGGNSRLRMVNTSGIINTVAGNGTTGFSGDGGQATNAKITSGALAFDESGNLYIEMQPTA